MQSVEFKVGKKLVTETDISGRVCNISLILRM
jgi:hypothetical protein